MRIIATVTNDSLGLAKEVEVLGANEATMDALVELGYAEYYDDTKPLIGKSLNPYQPLVYNNGIQVIYNDSIYVSNVGVGNQTSSTWVASEWTCLVHGTQAV